MSSEFYSFIIKEEKERFGIPNEKLKAAANAVGSVYSKRSLKKGSTYIDYNNPEYRCAYLYKYANLHTGMVTKYCRRFVNKKVLRNHFQKGIKVCSLGGGPGTDIIGVFKALAVRPYFQHRINEVSVLDICGGWSNTFDTIISGLLTGKVKNVPETFVSRKKFKHELVEIDLLQPLPENVVEIISEANIICMVKFISVILAKKGCLDTLKVLGNLFKPGCLVLFIDNSQRNVFGSIKDILNEIGLETVLGPLDEVYVKHLKQQDNEIYGCLAQTAAKVTVAGLMKRDTKSIPEILCPLGEVNYNSWSKKGFISTSFSSDDDDYNENSPRKCDKFIQTEFEDHNNLYEDPIQPESWSNEVEELSELMKSLLKLSEVIQKVKKNNQFKQCSCHCHSNYCFS